MVEKFGCPNELRLGIIVGQICGYVCKHTYIHICVL